MSLSEMIVPHLLQSHQNMNFLICLLVAWEGFNSSHLWQAGGLYPMGHVLISLRINRYIYIFLIMS